MEEGGVLGVVLSARGRGVQFAGTWNRDVDVDGTRDRNDGCIHVVYGINRNTVVSEIKSSLHDRRTLRSNPFGVRRLSGSKSTVKQIALTRQIRR